MISDGEFERLVFRLEDFPGLIPGGFLGVGRAKVAREIDDAVCNSEFDLIRYLGLMEDLRRAQKSGRESGEVREICGEIYSMSEEIYVALRKKGHSKVSLSSYYADMRCEIKRSVKPKDLRG